MSGGDSVKVDEEVTHHLEEAERNKALNAQMLHAGAPRFDLSNPAIFHKELTDKLD